MPDYTDPYTPIRRIERDIRTLTGKKIRFVYEKDDKGRTNVAVYYTRAGSEVKLTSFHNLDLAEDYAKAMVDYYGHAKG